MATAQLSSEMRQPEPCLALCARVRASSETISFGIGFVMSCACSFLDFVARRKLGFVFREKGHFFDAPKLPLPGDVRREEGSLFAVAAFRRGAKKPARWFWGQRAGVSFDCDYLEGLLKNAPACQHAAATTGAAVSSVTTSAGALDHARMLPNVVFPVK